MRRAERHDDLSEHSRRTRRAHTAPMAVGYQLLHLVEQLSLRAIVVADDMGVTLARAGDLELSALLADSAMWSGFASTSVDDMTLTRIQQRYPDIEIEHVASRPIGTGGVTVLAVGTQETSRAAVRRAAAGIARICATTNAGPLFLDEERGPEREVGLSAIARP